MLCLASQSFTSQPFALTKSAQAMAAVCATAALSSTSTMAFSTSSTLSSDFSSNGAVASKSFCKLLSAASTSCSRSSTILMDASFFCCSFRWFSKRHSNCSSSCELSSLSCCFMVPVLSSSSLRAFSRSLFSCSKLAPSLASRTFWMAFLISRVDLFWSLRFSSTSFRFLSITSLCCCASWALRSASSCCCLRASCTLCLCSSRRWRFCSSTSFLFSWICFSLFSRSCRSISLCITNAYWRDASCSTFLLPCSSPSWLSCATRCLWDPQLSSSLWSVSSSSRFSASNVSGVALLTLVMTRLMAKAAFCCSCCVWRFLSMSSCSCCCRCRSSSSLRRCSSEALLASSSSRRFSSSSRLLRWSSSRLLLNSSSRLRASSRWRCSSRPRSGRGRSSSRRKPRAPPPGLLCPAPWLNFGESMKVGSTGPPKGTCQPLVGGADSPFSGWYAQICSPPTFGPNHQPLKRCPSRSSQ
mmetsp:Transcript_106592/g.343941  ORF Transcript_106592/g.343941 Transcript_106592/m.343941 type:complete len:470 (+) Transcript_106592:1877-3286(+)